MASLLNEEMGKEPGTITQSHVSKWENGQVIPKWPVALAWLTICGHSPRPTLSAKVRAAQAAIAKRKAEAPPRREPVLLTAPLAEGDPEEYATVGEIATFTQKSRWAIYHRLRRSNPQPYNFNNQLAARWEDVQAMTFRDDSTRGRDKTTSRR